MMRWLSMVMVIGVLGGCATGFVGRWQTDELPESSPPDAATVDLMINKDHTFIASFDDVQGNVVFGFSGTWEKRGKEQIQFASERAGEGTGQLVDKQTLLVTSESGTAVKLQRAKE